MVYYPLTLASYNGIFINRRYWIIHPENTIVYKIYHIPITHYCWRVLFLDILKRLCSSEINSWWHLSMKKTFMIKKVGSHESLRLQHVVVFNTCMMSLYHYFKPLHSKLPDPDEPLSQSPPLPVHKLAYAKIACDHNWSIDAWCECALKYM